MPSGKREAAAYHELAALAKAQPEEIRTRRAAAEATLSAVRARLGAPGTYGTTTSGTPTTGEGAFGAGLRDQELEARHGVDRRYSDPSKFQKAKVLDPEAYTAELEKSTEFRLMSKLTAEAEQLVNREGPLYDEMIKNIQLPILEGAGAMARENAESLRRDMQRGGAARRAAFASVQEIRSRERINSQKTVALANSRLALDKWARDNARTQLEFNQNWAANLGGVREEYNRAMDMASELMLTKALPFMAMAKEKAAQWRYYAHAKKRAKVGQWITGILGVAQLAMGSPQGASTIASAFSGGPVSPAEAPFQTAGGGGGGSVFEAFVNDENLAGAASDYLSKQLGLGDYSQEALAKIPGPAGNA